MTAGPNENRSHDVSIDRINIADPTMPAPEMRRALAAELADYGVEPADEVASIVVDRVIEQLNQAPQRTGGRR